MATAAHVQVSPSNHGIWHTKVLSEDAASESTAALQDNHDHHHIFMNSGGLHNHTAHHILTLYALGASTADIRTAYDNQREMQRSCGEPKADLIDKLQDRSVWSKYFGDFDNYSSFLAFFRSEIDRQGVAETVKQHLFSGDEAAEGMLKRLFAGFLHPIIHVGFGLEFDQPAIVAEGLAMAACSSSWAKDLIDKVESVFDAATPGPEDKTLFALWREILKTPKLVESVDLSQGIRVRDGILRFAPDEMAGIASQWRVTGQNIDHKLAELIDFCAFQALASQRAEKHVQVDFVFMHALNATIFLAVMLKLDWISVEEKCRLLQMKGWMDLGLYVAQGSPDLNIEEIKEYKPKVPGDWSSVIKRTIAVDNDDSHVCKMIRALLHGQDVCRPFETQTDWPIKGEDWLQCGHILIDAVESTEAGRHGLNGIRRRWVRGAGFAEAWHDFPPRPSEMKL